MNRSVQYMVAGIVGLVWIWKAQDQKVAAVTPPWIKMPDRNWEAINNVTKPTKLKTELEELRSLTLESNSELAREIENILPWFSDRLWRIIHELEAKEWLIIEAQRKHMWSVFAQVKNRLREQKQKLEKLFQSEGRNPTLQEIYRWKIGEIDKDVEIIDKLPSNYRLWTIDESGVLITLRKIVLKYDLETGGGKLVIETIPQIVAGTETKRLLEIAREFETNLNIQLKINPAFQVSNDLQWVPYKINNFMGIGDGIDIFTKTENLIQNPNFKGKTGDIEWWNIIHMQKELAIPDKKLWGVSLTHTVPATRTYGILQQALELNPGKYTLKVPLLFESQEWISTVGLDYDNSFKRGVLSDNKEYICEFVVEKKMLVLVSLFVDFRGKPANFAWKGVVMYGAPFLSKNQ